LLWRTHFIAGAGLGAVYGAAFHPNEPLAMAASTCIGGFAAALPDIDSPHSKLGRAVRPVSDVLSFTLGHRGVLHSLLGMVFTIALFAFIACFWVQVSTVWNLLIPAAAIGYLSHLALDALTPGGVPLFWPKRRKYSLPLVKTGSPLERVVFLPALAATMLIFFWGVV